MEEYTEFPIHRLVESDRFYPQVEARLGDPNEIDFQRLNLLHRAALSRHPNSRVLKLLLDRGADLNLTSPQGLTPLHFAVASRKRETVVALIEAGASVNSKTFWGRTILHFAITKGWPGPTLLAAKLPCDMWIVKKLINHPDINLNPLDRRGETPLMWAVRERNPAAVEELLKKGANPNIPNENRRTPLHEALSARNPNHDIISLLLTNGADIYCADNNEKTPLDILVENIKDDHTHSIALRWIRLIVLRYHYTEDFICLIKKHPELIEATKRFCNEVGLMKSVNVYGKFNLHDFALGCIQLSDGDPVTNICIPVVELLLSGFFMAYFELILHRIPTQDLRSMCGKMSDYLIPSNASHLYIFNAISDIYAENETLKWRLDTLVDFLNFYLNNR